MINVFIENILLLLRVERRAKLKKHLYFVKQIMRKVSYIPLENILADNQLYQEKVEFLIAEEAVGTHFLNKFISASTAHERTTLVM